MDIEAIARRLTPAMERAVTIAGGTHEVITSPEMEPLWFSIRKESPHWFSIGLTQTGLAVRAYLEGK